VRPALSALGVGHILKWEFKFPTSDALGVGRDPHAFPRLTRSGVVCSEHTPSRIEPHAGKVLQDGDKSASAKEWRVFDEHIRRTGFTDDAGEVAPQAASRPGKPGAASCRADVLAWETAADDIDAPTPRPTVESSDVVPDWKSGQVAVSLPSEEHAAAIGINLDSADGAPSKEFSTQDASSCPCKKCQLTHPPTTPTPA
jgi:hypothetical protein